MSRRAMIVLILAIVAVHGVLLGLFLATGSAERELEETRRELEEENALRSAMESGEVLPSETQDESAPEADEGAYHEHKYQKQSKCVIRHDALLFFYAFII